MKLPEDLNAAEQQLRDCDLPELDQQTQLLKKQIQVRLPGCITSHLMFTCLHPNDQAVTGILERCSDCFLCQPTFTCITADHAGCG